LLPLPTAVAGPSILFCPARPALLSFSPLQDLAADLAQITFDYPFRIPPYFALVIRAIGEHSAVLDHVLMLQTHAQHAAGNSGSHSV
jgi:hypothetical protein